MFLKWLSSLLYCWCKCTLVHLPLCAESKLPGSPSLLGQYSKLGKGAQGEDKTPALVHSSADGARGVAAFFGGR